MKLSKILMLLHKTQSHVEGQNVDTRADVTQ